MSTEVPADILRFAFSLPPLARGAPSIGGQSLGNGDFVVVSVDKIQPGVPAQADPKERELLKQDIAARQGSFDYYLYTTQHLGAAKIKYEEKP